MKRLFIAEKPSLGREIANGLGTGTRHDGYIEIGDDIVTWEFGHLLENYSPEDYDDKYKAWHTEDLPIIPTHWEMKLRPDAKKQFGIIKGLLAKTDVVVNGGDPDREGQLLVDELLEYLKNRKPVKRILLNALDKKSVHDALNHLQDNENFSGLRDSARARSYADWLVGMNLTRAFSAPARQAGFSHGVRIGRVKTPTMSLVVRREDEIRNFKPVTYYVLHVDWMYQKDATIHSVWQPDEEILSNACDSDNHLLKQEFAERVLERIQNSSGPAVVSKIEEKEKTEPQRLPYSLSDLQVEAGRKFGYDPKKVLAVMQGLYEKKLTTYPRSDCPYLPENQFQDASVLLKNLGGLNEEMSAFTRKADPSIRSRAWNDKKITAHHAIIPTEEICNIDNLEEAEKNLYLMVAKAYLAQFYPVHQYRATKLWIENEDETFTATGKVILEEGWKSIYTKDDIQNSDSDSAKESESGDPLPDITEGETVNFHNGRIKEKETKPPQRFTTATLLKAMKEIHKYVRNDALKKKLKAVSGIGTEATRAGIIDALITSHLLRVEKKYLVPTEEASTLFKILPDELTWPDMTAVWEDELEDIKEHKLQIESFLSSKISSIKECVSAVKHTEIEPPKDIPCCPTCGKPLARRKGKYGFFWSCTGYPDCKNTMPDKKGKPDFDAARKKAAAENLHAKCPKCGKDLKQINGSFGTFWTCTDRDQCGAKFSDYKNAPVIVKCPDCKNGYLKQVKGKKGIFWSCDQYPNCKAIFKNKNGIPDIPNS